MRLLVTALALASLARLAAAAPPPDCPEAFRPYSTDTLLVDLLAVPATRAAIARDAPALLALSPVGGLLSPAMLPAVIPQITRAQLATLNADLANTPVTPAAAVLRCARYDTTPPTLPAVTPPAVLVFSKTTGYRHASIPDANAMVRAIGAGLHVQTVFTENGAAFTPVLLRRFAAVVWNNVSGDVLTLSQRAAMKAYIVGGGGFVGIHAAGGDPKILWDWYRDTLIRARFRGHPLHPQFQPARIDIAADAGPIARGLAPGWTMTDEWYSFATNPRAAGAHIIATLDEASYRGDPHSPFGDLRMGDHPIAWSSCVGRGRAFYAAIGHLAAAYTEPHTVRLYTQALVWALDPHACRQP